MPALRQYLFSLVAAAIVCGVVSALGYDWGSVPDDAHQHGVLS